MSWGVNDALLIDQENINEASLCNSASQETRGEVRTVCAADSVVGWTETRPADEYVPADDAVVIVSVIRVFQPGKPVARRVVVTDPAKVAEIARVPARCSRRTRGWVSGCPAMPSKPSRTGSRSRRRRPRLPIWSRPPPRAVR